MAQQPSLSLELARQGALAVHLPMGLKLHELSPALRKRIEDQIAQEDRALGRVETRIPQPTPAQALDRGGEKREGGTQRLVVSLVRVGRRNLDTDNLVSSFKPMRDAIAGYFCRNDADPIFSWQYGQQLTAGSEGCLVMIEAHEYPHLKNEGIPS